MPPLRGAPSRTVCPGQSGSEDKISERGLRNELPGVSLDVLDWALHADEERPQYSNNFVLYVSLRILAKTELKLICLQFLYMDPRYPQSPPLRSRLWFALGISHAE
jgi:hypothetical protein